MKNNNTDSTANLSRFARDKRQRISSPERVERSPRPRREADNEGRNEYRPRTTAAPKRVSYNPHFTDDNRLRSEYEQRPRRNDERSDYRRSERAERPERTERAERTDYRRSEGSAHSSSYRGKGGDARRKPAGESRSNGSRPSTPYGEKRNAGFKGGNGGAKRGATSKGRDDKQRSYPKYNPNKPVGEMRLNRFISQSGVCSRREADDFILAGVVTVNGQVVTELGTKILPTDEVRFNDERLQGEKNVYLVLNKPKGYVTTLEDDHAEKTVMELVQGACKERIYPVGRLDKNSLGLLLFTNDGDITRQLTHPSLRKRFRLCYARRRRASLLNKLFTIPNL